MRYFQLLGYFIKVSAILFISSLQILLYMKSSWQVIGLMSGTSLDGLDAAYCAFTRNDDKWQYELLGAFFVPYPHELQKELQNIYHESARNLVQLNLKLGKWYGKVVRDQVIQMKWQPDFIASHGQTIFHDPAKGYTTQIGDAMALHLASGIPVIADFRHLDVLLGGQGAPLVPIGDKHLFSDYDFRLNIGGFANISFEKEGETIAFDISAANIIINDLACKLGKPYDHNGELGAKGILDPLLLNTLNQLDFYKAKPPKSLGYEWVENEVWPALSQSDLSLTDQLHTYYHHLAFQISNAILNQKDDGKLLITGGGAHNSFLVELIRHYSKNTRIILPDKNIIDYKEAIIFAFLGLLRWLGESNTLSSATGASQDSSGGIIYNNIHPKK